MKDLNKGIFRGVIIAVITVSALMVVNFFLPYTSATGEHREILEEYSDGTYFDAIGMTNGDAVNISFFEFARIYSAAGAVGQGQYESIGAFYCTVIVLFGLFSLGTLIFASLRKPIGILIFNGLTFAVFLILNWDFQDRGLVQNGSYNFGAAYYIYYICTAIIFVGAVVMLVMKILQKKQNKTAQTAEASN